MGSEGTIFHFFTYKWPPQSSSRFYLLFSGPESWGTPPTGQASRMLQSIWDMKNDTAVIRMGLCRVRLGNETT